VAKRRNPVRLVVALSVAAVLAVFLIWTSLAGGTPSLQPSQLEGKTGEVGLAGIVVGPVTGDARADGMRFQLRDIEGTATVPVVYTGSVPDLFKVGREIYVKGQLTGGTFVATEDSLVTKCPSKYAPESGYRVPELGRAALVAALGLILYAARGPTPPGRAVAACSTRRRTRSTRPSRRSWSPRSSCSARWSPTTSPSTTSRA
jgi:cytochrome c-type biogenesis protein CcmE